MARPTTSSPEDQQPAPVAEPSLGAPPIDDREFVSVREAVRLSGLGRTKLYQLMSVGRVKYTKVDKRRLVVRRSISTL